MINVLLIGLGGLGLRHAQSLIADEKVNLFIYEKSEEVLRKNLKQIEDQSRVKILNNINQSNKNYFCVIVATPSLPRLEVLKEIREFDIQFFILEKFLFPSLAEFDEFEEIYSDRLNKIYINCPRRYYDFYKELSGKGELLGMTVTGSSWSMATNAIHFLDLFSFLTDDAINQGQIIHHLRKTKSKRDGYDELIGEIIFHNKKRRSLLLSCKESKIEDFNIHLNFEGLEIQIDEIKKSAHIRKGGKDELKKIQIPFQSQLTASYINDLKKLGSCELVNYSTSSNLHRIFLETVKNTGANIT